MAESEVEQRLNHMMAQHPTSTRELQQDLQQVVLSMTVAGHHPERIAYAVAQHATAFISGMKMSRTIRPELANLLAEDFVDMVVRRSIPGLRTLIR